ncbi:hypothetical protein CCGE531_30065 (plasmid) [Rhizobium sp. CCGE531]|nr:hypothetical protein CCGE531_30065 [Rhizobium sp. CCGE531]
MEISLGRSACNHYLWPNLFVSRVRFYAAYYWNGARTRRIKILKFSVSLLIGLTLLAGPAIMLVRAHP